MRNNREVDSFSDTMPAVCKVPASHLIREVCLEMDSLSERLHHRGQVDVIEMQERASTLKYLFVYEDLLSRFVVLKALPNDTAKEVATELLNVFTIIGPPQVLQSNNGRSFSEQVIRELRTLWEGLFILHGEVMKTEEKSRDFESLLKRWLQKNPTRTWYEGLKFIQILQNTKFRCQNGKVPCEVLFGRNIREELQKLITEKVEANDVWTEEEWLKFVSYRKDESASQDSDDDRNNEDDFRECENDSHSEPKDDETYSKDIDSVNGFNFVNVKSEISSNSMQPEDLVSEDEVATNNSSQSSNELKCKICEKRYMKLGHLRNHMRTHVKRRKTYECTLCNKTFHVLSLYEKHMRQSHGQNNSSANDFGNSKRREASEASNDTGKEETPVKDSPKDFDDTNESTEATLSISDKRVSSLRASSTFARRRKLARGSRMKVNGTPTLQCTYCTQKFNFPSVLKRHMRSHTNERPYICDVCNKSFKQLGHLTQHSLTHKDYRSIQCSVCGEKFETLDALKSHSQSHQGQAITRPAKDSYRLFECDNCKKVFTTKSVLERHIFTHTHERQFACKICGKRFKQAGHVKSHMLVHTGERKFECTVCSKRFSLSNSLKKHMYVHNGEKPYQCDVCGARFLERRNLNGHLMTHTNERPFSCKICGKRYTLADTLRRHVSAAHEDGRTYQCEICAKMFKQLAHLSVHKKVHNDERPFQCHLCEKNFKHKNVLKSHLAIHANVRPFECDVCKATFVRKTNLQTHIASAHMNERPYVCTICGKRFKQISHLNGHVVVHSNSMPYQCDYCERRCNRLDNLKKHMRLHTKNKEDAV